MSLDKATLKASIKSKMKELSDSAAAGTVMTSDAATDAMAGAIADAIDTFVKGGTVAVPAAGLSAPNGPCSGSATGTIS